MRLLRVLLVLAVAAALAFYGLVVRPLREAHPVPLAGKGVLAITGAKVYVSPDRAPLLDATVIVRDGVIAAVGKGVPVPAGAEILPCDRCVVMAGFWNVHVHFTERVWSGAEWKPARTLQPALHDMLNRRGFTSVVDLGSNLLDTVPLRRRIEQGELAGPRIYTAGAAQYPPNGIPYYLKDTLPRWLIALMPQPASPAAAARDEERNLAHGADLLKLFTGSYIARGTVLAMPLANARAAVRVAHAHGQIAFAHESDLEGATIARESGVDVLAHAIDTTAGVDDALLQSLIARHMAMVPTLKMFAVTVTRNPAYLDPIHEQVGRFHALGGDLLFGTDVGYMRDDETSEEFTALAACGLDGPEMLRMLTVAPATRFGVLDRSGTVEVGKAGDLVMLGKDPMGAAPDAAAFSSVVATVRAGRVMWRR